MRQFQRGCADINRLFLDLARQGIMEYRDHWPKGTSEHNIERVATEKTRRRKFRRILEGLNERDSVQEQAAYLLRAFSGLQLFPDANHRTGLVFVAYFLDLKGYVLECGLTEVVKLVEDIRPERGPFSARRTADRLTEHDASFKRVLQFMQAHVQRKPWWLRFMPRRAAGRLLAVSRKLPLQGMHVPEDSTAELKRKQRRGD